MGRHGQGSLQKIRLGREYASSPQRPGQFIRIDSGDVQAFWPAISSVLSGVSGGAKIGCVASPFNKIARELVVRKEIDSLAALREKVFGVQSIGGGFWLQTMIVLDRLGVEPEKNKLQMRVIGDEPTILQALLASNIDAAVMTFASAGVAKRAGLRSLANTADLKVPYQGVGICTRSDRIVNSPDVILRLVKRNDRKVVFSQDPRHKREVMAVLKETSSLELRRGRREIIQFAAHGVDSRRRTRSGGMEEYSKTGFPSDSESRAAGYQSDYQCEFRQDA